jgi:hypothetical protein
MMVCVEKRPPLPVAPAHGAEQGMLRGQVCTRSGKCGECRDGTCALSGEGLGGQDQGGRLGPSLNSVWPPHREVERYELHESGGGTTCGREGLARRRRIGGISDVSEHLVGSYAPPDAWLGGCQALEPRGKASSDGGISEGPHGS